MLLRRFLERAVGLLRRRGVARAQEREEVLVEEKAENEQDRGPADADVHPAEAEPAAAAAAAAIFNV